MYSLREFRRLLGAAADGLSDDEIIAIRTLECALADVIIDLWLRERSQSRTDMRHRAL